MIGEFGYSQNDLAKSIGKSRSHVANTLRLLKLPDSVKRSVSNGELTAGHARALLSVADPDFVALEIKSRGLTVRDAEAIAKAEAKGAGRVARPRAGSGGQGYRYAGAGEGARRTRWASR